MNHQTLSSKYLIDTNVLSELAKPRPSTKIVNFVNNLSKEDYFVSCISIGEIKKGIILCRDKEKSIALNLWFEKYLLESLQEQILDINSAVMTEWAELRAKIKNPPIIDSLIAATCLAYRLKLVTRSVKDFDGMGLKIINPWE